MVSFSIEELEQEIQNAETRSLIYVLPEQRFHSIHNYIKEIYENIGLEDSKYLLAKKEAELVSNTKLGSDIFMVGWLIRSCREYITACAKSNTKPGIDAIEISSVKLLHASEHGKYYIRMGIIGDGMCYEFCFVKEGQFLGENLAYEEILDRNLASNVLCALKEWIVDWKKVVEACTNDVNNFSDKNFDEYTTIQ